MKKTYLFLCLIILSSNLNASEKDIQRRIIRLESRINKIQSYSDMSNNVSPKSPSLNVRLQSIEGRIKDIEKSIDKKSKAKVDKDKLVLVSDVKQLSFAGMEPGQLLEPRGLDVSSKGLFVANYDNKRIEHLTLSGKYINYFENASDVTNEKLLAPVDVACAYGDSTYVIDKELYQVLEYNSNGTLLNSFGGLGDGEGEFNNPSSLAIDSRGNIYIVDTGNDRIQKLDRDGAFIESVGGFGNGDDSFNRPVDVALDVKNNVYILDQGNKLVKKYNEYLQYLTEIKLTNQYKPRAIRINDNYLYVVYKKEIIQISLKDNSQKKLMISFKDAQDIAFYNGRAYVTDSEKHLIYSFSL